jgi:hypothetical protein
MSRVETIVDAAIVELLAWVTSRPRTYAEAMEAWQSHCPRLTVWEDALLAGLVCVVRSRDGQRESRVALTPLGQATLDGRKRQPTAVV